MDVKNEDFDMSEDFKVGDLNRIIEKSRELFSAQENVKKLEHDLAKAKDLAFKISTEELPAIVAEESCLKKFEFEGGYVLEIKPFVTGNIPSSSAISKCKDVNKACEMADRREECFSWLKENDGASIIANKLTVDVPKQDNGQEIIDKIAELANELKLSHHQELSVHHSTLNSFLRETIENTQKDVPFDTFSVFSGEKAILKKQKNK